VSNVLIVFMLSFGVYEALRTYGGVFALLPEHQERLQRSCEALSLECPDLAELLLDKPAGEQRVRVDCAVSQAPRLKWEALPEWHGSFLYEEQWAFKRVRGERERPELKTMDTAFQTRAREQAREEGFQEVLLIDERGFVREGSISNVFLICEGVLVTPAAGMLPGIARSLILQVARECSIPVEERSVLEAELDGAEAVFLSNSIRGMVPTGPIHLLMQRLADRCTLFINQRIDAAHADHGHS
jgi:branched-subunit amino acid aminotransferase/4-amino-4-deoxychorismate lyase